MVIQKSESVMNGFFQAFRMEVLRAIQNSFFPTTYFAILITLFLNIYLYTTTDSYVSVAYLLEYSFIGSLTMLFYVWGVLPHGLSYCVDKRSGFLRQIGNRCPVRNYCIAKCCAAFLTSALTMAMSISTFLWLLSFFRPLDNDVYLDASGYRLWYPSHPLFYFIIAATILSLGSGLFSIVALWISSYIQNSFALWLRRCCSIIPKASYLINWDSMDCGFLAFPQFFISLQAFHPQRQISSIHAAIC